MNTLFSSIHSGMNNKNLFTYVEPLIILFLGVFLFLTPIFFGPSGSTIDWQHVVNVWLMLVPYVILYLLNRFILFPFLFLKKKRLLFLLSSILLILIMAITVNRYFDHRQRTHNVEMREGTHPMPPGRNGPPPLERGGIQPYGRPQNPPPKQLPPYLSFIIIGVLIVGFDTGLRLSVKWVQSEQQRIKAEKENMESQLAMLRTQVSPHFFMNTLNNIHALIEYDTNGAKDAVIRLSKLMRHLLYESERGEISLYKEVSFVKHYVELMKIRFSEKVNITLETPAHIPEKNIPPLLFTSYIENAFKHGISYKEESYVHIKFECDDASLNFTIENSNHSEKKQNQYQGIGNKNSRKRLDILFGKNYELNVMDAQQMYQVKLNIPI